MIIIVVDISEVMIIIVVDTSEVILSSSTGTYSSTK
jgi:hypothetical protein